MNLKSMLCLSLFLVTCDARQKRCYVCRSRGPLGDCKDPFLNISSSTEADAVKRTPCPSGWCGKSLEGKPDDHLLATHRLCLLTGPSDSVERCSDTIFAAKKVFMCFCKGDLCNSFAVRRLSHFLLAFVVSFHFLYKIQL